MSYKQRHRKPNLNIGYTTRNHLCLDLDKTSTYKATKLINILMNEYPELGDALLLVSSSTYKAITYYVEVHRLTHSTHPAQNIHVIFSNTVPYEHSCRIIEALARLDVVNQQYVHIRQMRNDMTLRVSRTELTDHTKPKPKPITYIVNPNSPKIDEGILNYQTLYNLA